MCRGVQMHIASDLWKVDSALCAEDGGIQIGGMEGPTPPPTISNRKTSPRRAVCHTQLRAKKSDENSHRSFCLFYLSILYVAYARICPFTKSQAFDITKSG